MNAILGDTLEALRIAIVMASPAIPDSALKAWRRLGLAGDPSEQRLPEAAEWGQYPGGLPVQKGAPLFPKLAVAQD